MRGSRDPSEARISEGTSDDRREPRANERVSALLGRPRVLAGAVPGTPAAEESHRSGCPRVDSKLRILLSTTIGRCPNGYTGNRLLLRFETPS